MTWEYGTKDLIIMCLTIISIVFINVYFKKTTNNHRVIQSSIKTM